MVVDDHPVFTEALAVVLGAEDDMVTVGTANHAHHLKLALHREAPDVLVIDVDLGSESGIDLLSEVDEHWPQTRTVVLTCHDDEETACAAIRAGATGFVSKSAAPEELVGAIRAASRGESWIPPKLLRPVLQRLQSSGEQVPTPEEEAFARLTAREREVLGLMVAGLDRATIAKELFVSPNTVRTHAQNLLAKLGAHSSLEAVAIALRLGLRPPARDQGW
jgi:DNA-binding NarL/FixJ family response regulator